MADLFDTPFEEDDHAAAELNAEDAPAQAARERKIYSVSELTQEIRRLLEEEVFVLADYGAAERGANEICCAEPFAHA